jgi:hypothetical protein
MCQSSLQISAIRCPFPVALAVASCSDLRPNRAGPVLIAAIVGGLCADQHGDLAEVLVFVQELVSTGAWTFIGPSA